MIEYIPVIALLFFICLIVFVLYYLLKHYKKTDKKETGYISTLFSRAKKNKTKKISSPLLHTLYQMRKSRAGEWDIHSISLCGEIFDVLEAIVPASHAYICPICSLDFFMEYQGSNVLLKEFCKDNFVAFVIVGKVSKKPLIALDYLKSSLDEQEHIIYATKKVLFQHIKIPFVLIKEDHFIDNGIVDKIKLSNWLKERIKFKTS